MHVSLSGKVHRDLKLENILLSKEEEDVEDICIKVSNADNFMSLPCKLLSFVCIKVNKKTISRR